MPSMSAATVILEYICPALGVFMANAMFAAPYLDLKRAVKRGSLGELNPTPWAFMIGNCFGWAVYSVLARNIWTFCGTIGGFLLSIYLNLGAVKLQYKAHQFQLLQDSMEKMCLLQPLQTENDADHNTVNHHEDKHHHPSTVEVVLLSTDDEESGRRDHSQQEAWNLKVSEAIDSTQNGSPAPAPHERLVMIVCLTWTILTTTLCFGTWPNRTKTLVSGILANINLLFFYSAPLSTIYKVVTQRSSASIHIPTMFANTLNGAFWTAYGLAVKDYVVTIPNAFGAVIGVVQILLCLLYPRKSPGAADPSGPIEEMQANDDVDPLVDMKEESGKPKQGPTVAVPFGSTTPDDFVEQSVSTSVETPDISDADSQLDDIMSTGGSSTSEDTVNA